MAKRQISVDGHHVGIETIRENDYVSLTDLAKKEESEPHNLIANWLKSRSTLVFIEAWEEIHNPDFKPLQMQEIRSQSLNERFTISPQKYIEQTGAIGLVSKSGRYGGTWAHSDIALEFCTWLNPRFKVYFMKEFKRMKEAEFGQKDLEWHISRITDLVDETRNWLDTIPGQLPARNRLSGPENGTDW